MATIEVILTEDIGKLGDAGDVVKVRAGFGRNYLLPQGKAMLATLERVNEIEHQKRMVEQKQRKAVAGLEDVARRAASIELVFEAQAGTEGKLFGSVTNADIAVRLAEGGVEVERRKIEIAEPIKQIGDHEVKLRLHREVIVPLSVKVVGIGVPAEPEDEESDVEEAPKRADEDDD